MVYGALGQYLYLSRHSLVMQNVPKAGPGTATASATVQNLVGPGHQYCSAPYKARQTMFVLASKLMDWYKFRT